MSITYTWKVLKLYTKDEGVHKNAVIQTYWQLTGEDERGNTGKFLGATPFTSANIDPQDFIAFEDLTEEIVLEWIKSVVTGDYKAHIEEQIEKQISESLSTVISPELPWKAQ